MERKDGARHAAWRAAAVAVDHTGICGGAGKWRSCLWSGVVEGKTQSRPTTTRASRRPKQSISVPTLFFFIEFFIII